MIKTLKITTIVIVISAIGLVMILAVVALKGDSELEKSLVIPRAVCVLAGAKYTGAKDAEGSVIIEVAASMNDKNWQIIQSPFMQKNASTTDYRQTITAGNGKLSYSQTIMVDIYGKAFEHTDENELILQ